MMVWAAVGEAIGQAGRCALVTVVAARGSAPREAGARLVVRPDGGFSGTVGGGALEWRAIAEATAGLAKAGSSADFRVRRRTLALGPELGQCCGGRVDLLVEVFGPADADTVAALAAREAAGPFATRGRVGQGAHVERRAEEAAAPDVPVVPRTAVEGGAGTASLLPDGTLVERFGEDRRPLYLFGAGHVGRALVLALAPLPFAVTWVDGRPGTFPTHVPGNVATLAAEDPAAVLGAAPAGSFVLAMTHSHALDLAVVAAALADGRFPHVGVIGSATKRARFERQLLSAGIAADRVAAMVCPIGAGPVRSKLPAAIAAMTAAELLARDEACAVAGGEIGDARRGMAG